MKEFLQALVDAIAVIFGDGPARPRRERPLELPEAPAEPETAPSPPPPPAPTEGEPQDASELGDDDLVIIDHEGEPPPEEDGAEFEDNPAPPPDDRDPEPEVEEPAPQPPEQPTNPTHKPRFMWCLDSGHGQLTPGKRSPILANGERLFEYEFNRDIVERIREQLEAIGIRYFVVVPEVEVGNFLKQRVQRANNLLSTLPKIFLSIHANAGPARSVNHWTADSARGIETWHFYGSSKGKAAANIFQRKLIARTGFRNRHVRSRIEGQFFILRATRMPAILTENGFYNNRFEVLQLIRDDVRQDIADAHVEAILEIERNGL